jgi:hypothetical protein
MVAAGANSDGKRGCVHFSMPGLSSKRRAVTLESCVSINSFTESSLESLFDGEPVSAFLRVLNTYTQHLYILSTCIESEHATAEDHTHVHTKLHIKISSNARAYMRTYIHTCTTHTYTNVYTCTKHTSIHTYIHTYTYIQTYIIHTYIHT